MGNREILSLMDLDSSGNESWTIHREAFWLVKKIRCNRIKLALCTCRGFVLPQNTAKVHNRQLGGRSLKFDSVNPIPVQDKG